MIKRPELPSGFPVSDHFVLFHPPFSSLSSPRMRHPRTEGSLTKPISPKIRRSGCRAIILIFFMAITPSLCPLARLSANNSESNGCAIQKAKCDPRIFQEIQNLLVVGEGSWSQGECRNRYTAVSKMFLPELSQHCIKCKSSVNQRPCLLPRPFSGGRSKGRRHLS